MVTRSSKREGPPLRRKLALIAGALVALCVGAEALLRALDVERFTHTNPDLYRVDDALSYRMRPNVRVYSHACWVETNRAGLRGPHWDEIRANGKEPVLFIGHSIAFGFGVEEHESYPRQFDVLTELPLASVNLGHCRYGYWQEFGLAHDVLESVRPAALCVMFTGNDFEDTYNPFAAENIDGAGADSGRVPLPGKRWLRRHSILYRFLRKSWSRALVAAGVREVPRYLFPRLSGDAASLAYFRDYETQLSALVDRAGVPVVLTAFPMAQTDASYEQLRGIAARTGARWVDLSDIWKSPADYMRRGAPRWSEHPSAPAHRILAERLTPAIDAAVRAARRSE